MTYPNSIGCEIPENEKSPVHPIHNVELPLERENYDFSELHEYLVVTDSVTEVDRLFLDGDYRQHIIQHILGWIDMNTKHTECNDCYMLWSIPLEEAAENYDDYFKRYTTYRVKGYPSIIEGNSIFITEVLSEGETDDYLSSLVEQDKQSQNSYAVELGDFTYNSETNELYGERKYAKNKVSLTLLSNHNSQTEVIEVFETFWNHRRSWDYKFKEAVYSYLLDSISNLSSTPATEVKRTIKMVSVVMDDDKNFTVEYSVGVFQGGRSVLVEGNLESGIECIET